MSTHHSIPLLFLDMLDAERVELILRLKPPLALLFALRGAVAVVLITHTGRRVVAAGIRRPQPAAVPPRRRHRHRQLPAAWVLHRSWSIRPCRRRAAPRAGSWISRQDFGTGSVPRFHFFTPVQGPE
eukprot:COSAG02_NODE_25266_length_663_cov_1.836879_1_plen_126_part_10